MDLSLSLKTVLYMDLSLSLKNNCIHGSESEFEDCFVRSNACTHAGWNKNILHIHVRINTMHTHMNTIHIYICIYIHTYVCVYIYICKHMLMYIYIRPNASIYVFICTYRREHLCIYMYVPTQTYTYL
jgi:hypothetical protein